MYNIFRCINFIDLTNFPKKPHNLNFDNLYMQHRRFRMSLSLCILMDTHYTKKPKYTYT